MFNLSPVDEDRFKVITTHKRCTFGDFYKRRYKLKVTRNSQRNVFVDLSMVKECKDIVDIVLMDKVKGIRLNMYIYLKAVVFNTEF